MKRAPFTPADLEALDERLLARADRVVPLWDVHSGDRGAGVIGLRHDVDDNPRSFETALEFARWEFERGYSSTYFLLHGAHYWTEENLVLRVPQFVDLGHEVGIHVNALAVALLEDTSPTRVLFKALRELRASGVLVRGCVAHGDALCHVAGFVNDEMFLESRRSDYGEPDRFLRSGEVVLALEPVSRSMFGLEYDANWLPRNDYLSDSGGSWSAPFAGVAERFAAGGVHLQALVHPDWWADAFAGVPA